MYSNHLKSEDLTFLTLFCPVFKWSDQMIRQTIQIKWIFLVWFSGVKPIRPKPDDQINKNRMTKYSWTDDRTIRPNFTSRPNSVFNIHILYICFILTRQNCLCNTEYILVISDIRSYGFFLVFWFSTYSAIWSFFGHLVFHYFGPPDSF